MAHYFTNSDVKSDIKKHSVFILDHHFDFLTDNGVFSKEKLDFGTRVFLENIGINNIYGEVLDVGCGYGPIGITVAKLSDCKVTMVDVNRRALHLAEMNAKENGIVNAEVIESDCYQNIMDRKFNFILTNPPIRAGKQKVYEIVMDARYHLKENGKLFIVVRKEQGAKSMINDLKEYYNVDVIAKEKGFFIISCCL